MTIVSPHRYHDAKIKVDAMEATVKGYETDLNGMYQTVVKLLPTLKLNQDSQTTLPVVPKFVPQPVAV